MKTRLLVGLGMLVLWLAAAACIPGGAQELGGAERDAALAHAEPLVDNLLAGLNAADYAVFSRDFNAQMREALNESAFSTTRTTVVGKIGRYVSRTVSRVEKQGDFVVVIYRAVFEQEDGVTVRVVFEASGERRIAGLWFDSPRLRQK